MEDQRSAEPTDLFEQRVTRALGIEGSRRKSGLGHG